MHPSGGAHAGFRAPIGQYTPARQATLNTRAASPTERDWLVIPATDLLKFGEGVRFRKYPMESCCKNRRGCTEGSSDPWAAATWVSVAARLLDGIVPFHKPMHARTHRKLPRKLGKVHGEIVLEVE